MISVQRAFTYIIFFSLTAQAKVDVSSTKKMVLPAEVTAPNGAVQFSERVQSNLTTNDSSQTVMTKMMDNTFGYFWDNSGIQNTSIGQAMKKVETKMKADVNLGSTSGESANKVDHKLSLRLLAAQALARIEYFGWFKCALQYDARSAASIAEITENLSNNKDLVISHSSTSSESSSRVAFRWQW
jgi:hypothetical protein